MTRGTVEQAHDMYDAAPYEVPMPDGSLYNLLNDMMRSYPDHIALDYLGATATYMQVRNRVLKAVRVLHEAGIRPGDTVAITLPNCPQAFVAFYARMRIEAIATQHNPLAPASEIAGQLDHRDDRMTTVWEKCVDAYSLSVFDTTFMVDISHGMSASQRLLLRLPIARAHETHNQLRGFIPSGTWSWDHTVISSAPTGPSFPLPSPDNRAIILHTSETNDIPKSAPLTHRNIGVNVNQCMFRTWKLHEGAETFFSLLPCFHAFGLTSFLCASVREVAAQVLFPKFDAQMTLDAHKWRPITFFVGVPPMFRRILGLATRTKTDLSSIHYSVARAMPLLTTLTDEWEEATGGMIVEGRDSSEVALVLTGAPLSDKHRHGVLGVPFPSAQLHLISLDGDTLDVENGQPGEVIVRGPQVLEGYLDAAEEAAHVFTSEGWFKTGDIGVNSDGFISMADRRKKLILSDGFNVYPSQVETAIHSHPSVSDVAVVGIPVSDTTEEIAAAIVMQGGSAPLTSEEIRTWAEKTIAHYALPRQLVVIAELPRN